VVLVGVVEVGVVLVEVVVVEIVVVFVVVVVVLVVVVVVAVVSIGVEFVIVEVFVRTEEVLEDTEVVPPEPPLQAGSINTMITNKLTKDIKNLCFISTPFN
jgi:hypothetical protein